MRGCLAAAALLLMFAPAPAAAQTATLPPKNPTLIAFTEVDHDNPELTGYEVDISKSADGTIVQTLVIAKATTSKLSTGEILVTVNVQPAAFGTYQFFVRAVAGAVKSDTSLPTEVWQRAPGAPGKPLIRK